MYRWIGWVTSPKRARLLGRILTGIPKPFLLALFSLAAHLLARFGGQVSQRIKDNMTAVLGKNAPVEHLRRQYFYQVCLTLYELLFVSMRLPSQGEKRFCLTGEKHLQSALGAGRGAILYAPHMGNFFFAYWLLSQRYPCLAVVTARSEELRPLYLMMQELGCTGLDYDETPPLLLLKKLRKHLSQNGVVFLLGDFSRPGFPAGSLFGRKTPLPHGAASLALHGKATVIPFYCRRLKGFTHLCVFQPPLLLHEQFRTDQVAEAMEQLYPFLEDFVRAVPEQWLYWFNVDERWTTEEHSSEEVS
ncbi:lysophospholipid acyltransferase family protein [Brevibacillus choshinensis]|uniref:Lysophospholipid acyltransferase family protein n=1 Tax=Brevibacillus choshinensis TaxID=54911 RepID=A0ABX7FR39_BRECH|nr:lysophospholipid acyltransferase family protein [Brevibacillus choshinensis]QRG68718.1 lysophospholipid acyltransferase family protein [Brevibacillus choshinensis]